MKPEIRPLTAALIDAGYGDVAVMPAGIKGWVDAGHTVHRPAAGRS
jgi:rhodanese-related sulfurtransferase